jgi:hypothetical protein
MWPSSDLRIAAHVGRLCVHYSFVTCLLHARASTASASHPRRRLVLPVGYTAYRCDVLDTSGAPNVVSVVTLLHKTALTSSWPTGSSGLMVDATPHGAEGNLTNAVAVVAAGTESTVVDVSHMGELTKGKK